MSNHPDDLAVRNQLLERSQGLADALGRASAELTAVEEGARNEVRVPAE